VALKFRESSIKTLMARQGIRTQAELAKRLETTPQALNRLLRNRRPGFTSVTLDRLCDVLDAEPGDFLYFERE